MKMKILRNDCFRCELKIVMLMSMLMSMMLCFEWRKMFTSVRNRRLEVIRLDACFG